MARLHEYQGKEILKHFGIAIPEGGVTKSPEEARTQAAQIGRPVVVKAQVWVTGRAGKNAIHFAADADDAERAARSIFGMQIGNFTVEQVLVEKQINIA